MLPSQNKLDDVYETLREISSITENEMNLYANLALFDYVNRDKWDKLALSTDKLNQVKSVLKDKGINLLTMQQKAITNAFKVVGIEDRTQELEQLQDVAKSGVKMLITSAVKQYKDNVNQVKKVRRLQETDYLYQAMLKQANKGFEKGLSVVYSNNRIVEYKGYMEMLTRTTISQAITNQQMEIGETTKTVFYICNSFGDCADDHAELQGKIYYDERYRDFGYTPEFVFEIQKAIQQKNMMSVQQVQDFVRTEYKGKRKIDVGYLTTRPNCRHRLVPITLEQALGDTNKLLNDMHLKRGTYRDSKYQNTQALRSIERNIRKYKDQEFLNRQIQNKGFVKGSEDANKLANQYKHLVSAWQKKARELCKQHPYLERDYDRETRTVIVQDLGIKYN